MKLEMVCIAHAVNKSKQLNFETFMVSNKWLISYCWAIERQSTIKKSSFNEILMRQQQ
jgi:hypothetical protein